MPCQIVSLVEFAMPGNAPPGMLAENGWIQRPRNILKSDKGSPCAIACGAVALGGTRGGGPGVMDRTRKRSDRLFPGTQPIM